MAHDTTPFPHKGHQGRKQTKRGGAYKNARSGKEGRTPRQRLNHQEIMARANDAVVRELCRKVYEQHERENYSSREAFCLELGDLVVNRKKVTIDTDRAMIVDHALHLAVERGLIEIFSSGRTRTRIRLSDAEYDRHKKLERAHEQRRERRWQQRRADKAA